MNARFYVPLYAFTLLISAALLFSVQPMFSKMILPLLGGTPQVWNTAMLFFQVALLLGYGYAHITSRFLEVKAQSTMHLVLMFVFVVVLPLGIPADWPSPNGQNPTLWQLGLMFMTVGGPFFILAASAPTLQTWFSRTKHKDADNPYFLYGASNLGSLSALLAYPVVIEPLFGLDMQAMVWAGGYIGLIVLFMLCAAIVWNTRKPTKGLSAKRTTKREKPVDWRMRGRWLVLAFVPSSLMLGVTTYITTDIASVPLLWILPLALYVSTFIFVFARRQIISNRVITWGLLAFLSAFIFQAVGLQHMSLHPFLLVFIHLGLFFFAALMCHQYLADARPAPSHLTEFYLVMSIGGALGGFFNAIIAPQFFIIPFEYPLVLILVCLMRYSDAQAFNLADWLKDYKAKGFDALVNNQTLCLLAIMMAAVFGFQINNADVNIGACFLIIIALFMLYDKRWAFAVGMSLVLVLFPPGHHWGVNIFKDVIHRDRNFFGVMKVVDSVKGERLLLHGTTNHGAQALDEAYKLEPLSYYSEHSPLRSAFRVLDQRRGKQEVAIVGLGIGVTACFQKSGRHFDFYEIDPAIAEIATNPDLFTYLSDCKSLYNIILGDGRLTLQEKPDQYYDLIVLDAFSSDNVPMHLLTLEAVQGYLSKLKDDGILMFNISNNYVDLEPALNLIAKELGYQGYGHLTEGGKVGDTDLTYFIAHFFMMTKSDQVLRQIKKDGWSEGQTREGVKLWTDQYSNIVSVLGNKTAGMRFKDQAIKKAKK